MDFKRFFRGNGRNDECDRTDRLLTPDELLVLADELHGKLRGNKYRSGWEGKSPLQDINLLCEMASMMSQIIDGNRRGRKGFDGDDSQLARSAELHMFSVMQRLFKEHLGWHLSIDLSDEERAIKEHTREQYDELTSLSRRLYGKPWSEVVYEESFNDDDIEWLRRKGLRPE
jgi:hypothetical protein